MMDLAAALPAHLTEDPRQKAMAKDPRNVLGKDDFMKLLMAQLKHQDPSNPMDHQQFAAELAQFGALEQLANIGKGIEALKSDKSEKVNLQALTLIGKRIKTSGNEVELTAGTPAAIRTAAKDGVTPFKVAVYGPGGKLVREMNLKGVAGSQIQWDGKDQQGGQLPTGRYSFRVFGADANGKTQEVGTELLGVVTGVELDGETPLLVVKTETGSTRVEISKVTGVSALEEPEKVKSEPKQEGMQEATVAETDIDSQPWRRNPYFQSLRRP